MGAEGGGWRWKCKGEGESGGGGGGGDRELAGNQFSRAVQVCRPLVTRLGIFKLSQAFILLGCFALLFQHNAAQHCASSLFAFVSCMLAIYIKPEAVRLTQAKQWEQHRGPPKSSEMAREA
jgi:hypothetical protein